MASKFTLRYFDKKWHVVADGDYSVMIGIVRGHYALSMIVNPDWNTVAWSIIRASDGLIIAQSKNAPADTATSNTAPAVAAQAEPVADTDIPFAEGMDDDTPLYADFVREQYARADAEDMAEFNSSTPDDVIAMDILATANTHLATAENMLTDFITGNEIWKQQMLNRNKVTGHGRTSRNRAKTRQNASNGVEVVKSVKNAGKRQNGANKGIVVMMERNTDAAKKWREKRELHNKTAMATAQITGAELLARGIQLVEKPKPLTRFLETRNRRRAAA